MPERLALRNSSTLIVLEFTPTSSRWTKKRLSFEIPFHACAPGDGTSKRLPLMARLNNIMRRAKMAQRENTGSASREEWVKQYCKKNPAAGRWPEGYGTIQHSVETQAHVFKMADSLAA